MRLIFFLSLSLWSLSVQAIPCDCEVMVYAPLTGSHSFPPSTLKTYELEEFASYSPKAQLSCRDLCSKRFNEDIPAARMTELLQTYSAKMIDGNVLGYNCTGLTTLKYPVRVRATLGERGLGNVADFVHVINHEVRCF